MASSLTHLSPNGDQVASRTTTQASWFRRDGLRTCDKKTTRTHRTGGARRIYHNLGGLELSTRLAFQRQFPVANVVYQLLYFAQLRLAASLACASLSRRRVLGLRRFQLGRGENKITGIILTLINVPICSHRYTLSRSFHPFPSLCDLLLMTHKHTRQLGKFLQNFTCMSV